MLNNTGRYETIKADGDPQVISYTWPGFVNIGLSFEYFVVQYLQAKRLKHSIGLEDDLITFTNQVLGQFHKAGKMIDVSKILVGDYTTDPNNVSNDWLRVLTVDCQKINSLKYYIVREWHKNGNESRLLDKGVVRSFEDIETVQKKWKVVNSAVGVDSGYDTEKVYQECVKHGQVQTMRTGEKFLDCWIAFKGWGKNETRLSFKHKDGINRYYSEESQGDCMWPAGSIYGKIPAKLYLWSNYSIKTILMNLRDNKVAGVRWMIDKKDTDYENQLYSEHIEYVLNKSTGLTQPRWVEHDENHFLDAEAMNLTLAIMGQRFSPTQLDERELLQLIQINTKPQNN